MSKSATQFHPKLATKKVLESRRERIWGWERIGAYLSITGLGLRRMIVRDGPAGSYYGLVKKDPATGRVFAFRKDLDDYLDDCPAFSGRAKRRARSAKA